MAEMEDYKKEFIEFMIDCEVLRFGDFVTKRDAVFCQHGILPDRGASSPFGRVLCQSDYGNLWKGF